MDEELKKILTQNPWAKMAQEWLQKDAKSYVLPEDKKVLEVLKAKAKGATVNVHLELPPQPFIGHPSAPLWILHLCPAYSEVDIYDMVSIAKPQKGKIVPENCTEAAFAERRASLFRQLDFSEPHPFYVLKEAFRTVEQDNRVHLNGTYGWWHNYLLDGTDSFLTEQDLGKCFVLEAFPYHVEKDDDKNWRNPTEAEIRKTRHHAFWKALMRYALTYGKTIVARRGVASLIAKCFSEAEANELCVFSSSQSIYLTKGNVAKRFMGNRKPTQAERDFAIARISKTLAK